MSRVHPQGQTQRQTLRRTRSKATLDRNEKRRTTVASFITRLDLSPPAQDKPLPRLPVPAPSLADTVETYNRLQRFRVEYGRFMTVCEQNIFQFDGVETSHTHKLAAALRAICDLMVWIYRKALMTDAVAMDQLKDHSKQVVSCYKSLVLALRHYSQLDGRNEEDVDAADEVANTKLELFLDAYGDLGRIVNLQVGGYLIGGQVMAANERSELISKRESQGAAFSPSDQHRLNELDRIRAAQDQIDLIYQEKGIARHDGSASPSDVLDETSQSSYVTDNDDLKRKSRHLMDSFWTSDSASHDSLAAYPLPAQRPVQAWTQHTLLTIRTGGLHGIVHFLRSGGTREGKTLRKCRVCEEPVWLFSKKVRCQHCNLTVHLDCRGTSELSSYDCQLRPTSMTKAKRV